MELGERGKGIVGGRRERTKEREIEREGRGSGMSAEEKG